MSKARTLANLISDNAELADGQISVAEVVGAAPLASPTFTHGGASKLTVAGHGITVDGSITLGTAHNIGDTYPEDDLNIQSNTSKRLILNGKAGIRFSYNGAQKVFVGDTETTFEHDAKLKDDKILKVGQNDDLQLYHDSNTTTNKLVGDLTQTGKLSTDELDLSAIAATISDTAVDIFVYDTRKDSDGGAWRKRTQHTSWYNEAASATRGSRKEFPAVAVIVAESNQVTIYDGDDPDMPMWMVFNYNSGVIYYTHAVSCVSMLNGILTIGISSTYGVSISNFVSENIQNIRNTFGVYTYNGSIVDRNSSSGQTLNSANPLVNGNTNDVAMTVLPNAPIDAATGLPVPTIAVATSSGTSVIRDDGTVVDISADGTIGGVDKVAFYGTNKLWTGCNTVGSGNRNSYSYFIPTSDTTAASTTFRIGRYVDPSTSGGNLFYSNVVSNIQNSIAYGENNIAADADDMGLLRISENETAPSTGMTNFVSSDYNTGWMQGAIKLATLSDTDDTNVTGAELVDNGLFSNGGDWSFGGGWNFANGQAEIDTTNNDLLSQDIGMVTGKTYTVSLVMTAYTDGVLDVRLGGNATQTATGTGVHTFTGVAGGSTLQIYAFTNATLSIDDISVRLAEEDRSVNGNGLQVFGTINKSAVASGADLVAYSNWGLSSYLKQPPNADIAVNSDRTFVTWFKTSYTSNYSYLFSIVGSSRAYGLAITTTDGYLYTYDNVNGQNTTSTAVADGSWHCAAMVHSGGYKKLYVDGKLAGTFAASDVTFDSDANLYLGVYYTGSSFNYNLSGGSMALFRMSHTAPSPEQIKKIYEDEKVLFQEGAQATLYGSSDAVTALAYDDSTELLHVGTSAGRSVFQGLRRVDNTTDAVGAAISASNGLVAED